MLEDFLFQDSCTKTYRGTYVFPFDWREYYFFTEHATMEDVLEKASVTESMFTSWLGKSLKILNHTNLDISITFAFVVSILENTEPLKIDYMFHR